MPREHVVRDIIRKEWRCSYCAVAFTTRANASRHESGCEKGDDAYARRRRDAEEDEAFFALLRDKTVSAVSVDEREYGYEMTLCFSDGSRIKISTEEDREYSLGLDYQFTGPNPL